MALTAVCAVAHGPGPLPDELIAPLVLLVPSVWLTWHFEVWRQTRTRHRDGILPCFLCVTGVPITERQRHVLPLLGMLNAKHVGQECGEELTLQRIRCREDVALDDLHDFDVPLP